MEEILDFFSKLLLTESWPARWFCGKWSDFHGWLYICSSLAIWAAYFAIPFSLFYLLRKKNNEIPFVKVLWLFILFILLCGLTHLVDVVIFWAPVYRLSALILFITAIISWVTVFGLYKVIPVALTLKSPEQLEKIVVERTRQLEDSNKNLVRLNKDMDNFIYSASHDLKSPVNNIEGLVQLLKSELKTTDLKENTSIELLLSKIETSATKVKNTVINLTDIVKIQSNPYEDIQNIDIREVLKEILLENEITVNTSNANITLGLNVETITYSRQAFKSILYNLIINSIKYKSPDRKLNIEITSSFNRKTNKIEVSVKDNGLGIDLELHKEKLFKLFVRFHDHIDGSGVGLYIINKIVEDKGGKIEVESTVNVGSIFKIIF
ncbi:sensor histidine kinase [Cytophaga hutchinsonii]|uniref:histidine kinase n=1 Tax=Cytophaga hutchinsonii (strain ATCC 33406 / DSM 1761 / CIP 103989 / NBRC 15051 / NCIMB 9469 / D465) TaxID=269798 RepID=A0A6N4SMB0_CYTH3|nr:HAMP domain-containing sensor histidine kinase [Cytophaga hutchinsonii]ABG57396.1 sensor histidine kinase [Cytophaga hutchinsonii ATCC 33406]SFX97402.1 hypothetical protein SAMN04487930_1163 [Cytophaga hutchinsonii ATCC 33406]